MYALGVGRGLETTILPPMMIEGKWLGMLRRISVFLLSVLLVLSLAGNVALAQPANRDDCDGDRDDPLQCDKGQPGSDEPKEPGSPDDPNAWGGVASELGELGVMGKHSSDPVPGVEIGTSGNETPRAGLGNEARNDATAHGVSGSCSDPASDPLNCDSGDHMADHACQAAAGELPGIVDEDGNPVQPDCTDEPGHSPEDS